MERLLIAGNTANGFVNYFNEFIHNCKTIFIKGGSGAGKSTFIREVGAKAKQLGYKTIEVPCSSDINSLDGVKICGLNLAVLDATSPHIFEPQLYGIDGNVFNFGSYLNETKLQPQTGIMQEHLRKKKMAYTCLYNELACIEKQYENINNLYMHCFNEQKFDEILKNFYEQISFSCVDRTIKAFCDYIDGDGYHNILMEYVGDRRLLAIVGRCPKAKYMILEALAQKLDYRKIKYEKYYSILNPTELYAIGFSDMVVFYADSGEGVDTDCAFEMSKMHYDIPLLLEHRHCINYAIKRTANYYKKAREAHSELEKIYLKTMDFEKLEKDKAEFIQKLFSMY